VWVLYRRNYDRIKDIWRRKKEDGRLKMEENYEL
jgi:hypothetical protein